jgi:PAS domain S-box-containing protein
MRTNEPSSGFRFVITREQLVRYGWALGIVCLAILLRVWLEPVVGKQAGLLFWAAILICPWIGGVVPSLIGQTMIWAAQWYWFTPPATTPWRPSAADLLFIAIYYLLGSTIGAASDLRRRAQQRERVQQAEAISQREQLRATLSCMADGVLVTDEQGRLTLMNPAAEVMTGWTMVESRGKRLTEFFAVHRENGENHSEDPLDHVLHSGQVVHGAMHLTLTTRSGQTIPIAYSAAPIRDAADNITGGVLVFRDESERRRNEQALRNADRQKDEFLATLAHELRNPLAPICLGVDLLRMPDQEPEEIVRVCAMMARQSQHMVRLIDDLMDVSRITRGKLELRKRQIALDEVVQNAVDANRPMIEQSQLRLVLNLPAHPILLYADPSRLTQVFSNLLNNAAKFTPADGCIEVSASTQGGNVFVTVTDSGIGIPPEKQDFIFDMFTQVDSGNESPTAGLGIGLTLVRRLAEMHGGTVSVESAGHNLGSRFRVQLPMIPPAPSAARSPKTAVGAIRTTKRRVLIVDDNADALASLSMVVRALGSETFDAHDGLEAVESARNLRPDVILMDIGMPRLNGYDAARRIREQPWGHDLLMVATTGWGKEEDRRRSKEAGFDFHLVKPIDVSAVKELLSSTERTQPNQFVPVQTAELRS